MNCSRSACKWKENRRRSREGEKQYLAWRGLAVVFCGGEDDGWTRWRYFFSPLLLPCSTSSSVFFVSLLSLFAFLFFSFRSSLLLSFFLFLLFFFCFFSLFFFLALSLLLYFYFSFFYPSVSLPLLFFSSPCVPFLPCIYKVERKTSTPAQSMAQGCRVDGAATVQPPLYHPRDTTPPLTLTRGKLCRWRVLGRRHFGLSGKGKSVSQWETGEKRSSSSPASRVQGKKKTHSAFKAAPFRPFFLYKMNSLWNGAVLGKTRRFI